MRRLKLNLNLINGPLMPAPAPFDSTVDAGLSKAEKMVARSYASAAVAERVRHGYAEYGSNRTFEHAYQVSCRDVIVLNEHLGQARKQVWRPLLRKSIRQTAIRSVVLSLPLAVLLAFITRHWAIAASAVVAFFLSHAWRSPSLALNHPRVALDEVFNTKAVARAIRRHHRKMHAAAFSDPVIAQHLTPVLESLDPPHRDLAQALQPGFPGSIAELLKISGDLAQQRR